MAVTRDILTIPETLTRARSEGVPLSEYSLRRLIRSGKIPARFLGTKALVSYSAVLRYLSCAEGQDNPPPPVTNCAGIRRVDM